MNEIELYEVLCLGLSDEYGIPYAMYISLIDALYKLSLPLAEELHSKVRVTEDRAYLPE